MALDDLQARILRTIAANRNPESHVAGGAVIQHAGPRLSDDIDVFQHNETDVEKYARLDLQTLKQAGFDFDITKRYPAFIEADVGTEAEGRTRVQWAMDSEMRFLRPVQDDTFGWRLQMPDLAVNKLVAAATRGEARDFVDLVFIDKHYMPLWVMAWAAPGKDEAFTPLAYLSKLEQKSLGLATAIKDVASTEDLDAKVIRRRLLRGIEIARKIYPKLNADDAGCLYTENGIPLPHPDRAKAAGGAYGTLRPTKGGAWPQIPEVTRTEIRSLSDPGDRTER